MSTDILNTEFSHETHDMVMDNVWDNETRQYIPYFAMDIGQIDVIHTDNCKSTGVASIVINHRFEMKFVEFTDNSKNINARDAYFKEIIQLLG